MCYRTQAPLHIHVDLVRRDVTAQLRPEHHPVETGVTCRGRRYAVAAIATLDANLFAALGKPPDQMARATIVIVGRPGPSGGFYELTSSDTGGEDLQVDHPRLDAPTFQALISAARGGAPAPAPPPSLMPHDGDSRIGRRPRCAQPNAGARGFCAKSKPSSRL